jgi:glycosyltransferase involved in cell wall biosynthesis
MFRNMIPFDMRVRKSIPWGLQRLRNWILQRVLLRSMARAELTIFISDHARKLIETLSPIKNPVTIPHGISDVFRTHDRELPRPARLPKTEYLLYVSRFDVYKHHHELVSAYARLPAMLRSRFPLLLAGETDLPEAERVRHLIDQLQLHGQVQMIGTVPYSELPALYHHAHANIFASSCENCPNILLEAMAAGRPVLSSNVMPMPEFGGADIAYFSPFDPDELAALLERTLTDPDYAARVARASTSRSQRYRWAVTAAETWEQIFCLTAHEHPHR